MADSFSWGGQSWGPGDLDAFKAWLSAHGASYDTWASEHPDADAILKESPAAVIAATVAAPPEVSYPAGTTGQSAESQVGGSLGPTGPEVVYSPTAPATESGGTVGELPPAEPALPEVVAATPTVEVVPVGAPPPVPGNIQATPPGISTAWGRVIAALGKPVTDASNNVQSNLNAIKDSIT